MSEHIECLCDKCKDRTVVSVEVGEEELTDIGYYDIDGFYHYVDINAAKAIIQLLKQKSAPKQLLECYSCGEEIKYDDDRPECYCNDCLPLDAPKQYPSEEEIEKAIADFDYNNGCIYTHNYKLLAKAIHNLLKEGR